MQTDSFKTISGTSEACYKVKGSRFLSFAHPIQNAEEVKVLLDTYKKKYHDARHVCFAYSLGINHLNTRSFDDGEPSGTAGRPILGQILSHQLTNVLVVVVRYFGGVLLGTGGLQSAYKQASSDVLDIAKVVEETIQASIRISVDFVYLDQVMKLVKKFQAKIVNQEFNLNCIMALSLRKNDEPMMLELLNKIETLCFLDEV